MLQKLTGFLRSYLKRIGETKVDEDTYVRKVDRDNFLLREGDHCMHIFAEMRHGPPDFVIDFGSISSWLPPHQHEYVTYDDRERIAGKLSKYFVLRNQTFEVYKNRGALP